MGNQVNLLEFKILVDGKEGVANVDMSTAAFKKLVDGAMRLNEIQLTGLTKQVYELSQAHTNSVEVIGQFIQSNQLSETSVRSVVGAMDEMRNRCALGSVEYMKIDKAIQDTNASMMRMKTQQSQTANGTGAMTQAMGQLGWAIGDSSMFMVNFRMGMMSVGNNIPMIVNGFILAKKEAEGLGKTIGQTLVSSLTGAGGLLVGINLVMFALQVLPQLFSGAAKEAENTADKIKDLNAELDKMSKHSLLQRLFVEKQGLRSLYDKAQEEKKPTQIIDPDTGEKFWMQGKVTPATTAAIKTQMDVIKNIETAWRNMGWGQDIQNLSRELGDQALQEPTQAGYTSKEAESERLSNLLKLKKDKDGKDKNDGFFKFRNENDKISREFEQQLEQTKINQIQDVYEQQIAQIKFDYKKWYDDFINKDAVPINAPQLIAEKKNERDLKLDTAKRKNMVLPSPNERKDVDFDILGYEKREKAYEELWQQTHQTTMAAIDGMHSGMNAFWDDFFVKGQSAKLAWSDLWSTMKQIYVQKLGEMFADQATSWLIDLLGGGKKAGKDGGGDSGGSFFGTLLTSLPFILFKQNGQTPVKQQTDIAQLALQSSYMHSINSSGVENVLSSGLERFTKAINGINIRVTATEMALLARKGTELLSKGEM